MPMRAACEPGLDLWRLVGRLVVHHEVDVWPLGDRGVDPLEEVEELGCPMALVAFPDHGAGGNVERGEQGCRDRKSDVRGKSGSVRVDIGGGRLIKNKKMN